MGQISSLCVNLTLVTRLLLVDMMMLFMLFVYDCVVETVFLKNIFVTLSGNDQTLYCT